MTYDDSATPILPGDQPLLVYGVGECDWVTVVEVGPADAHVFDRWVDVRLPDGRIARVIPESLCEPEV